MKLNQNLGTIDRVIRLVIAVLFAFLYFSGTVSGVLGVILLVLSAVFLATSVFAFCPLYFPFKFSTRKS